MHDFQHTTAEALPELIRQLKAGGYKVVHMVPRQPLTTFPKYDEMVTQQDKLSSNNMRPETSVIRTIGAHVLEPWSFQLPSSAGTSKSSSPGSGGAGGRGPAGALVRRRCTCRRAISGWTIGAAARPPSKVINLRRVIRAPHRRGQLHS